MEKNRIGIVGGGQLGRMLAQAAQRLGYQVIVLDPSSPSPAGLITEQIAGDFKDAVAINDLAKKVDFITFEIESANADALDQLESKGFSINPSPKTLRLIKDKFRQKEFLRGNNIPVAEARIIESAADIAEAGLEYGYPLLLKSRFDAYDGRGNFLIHTAEDIEAGLQKLNKGSLYVEKFVPFVKELAVVAARGADGSIVTYPVVETIHQNNICHLVVAPAAVSADVIQRADQLAAKVMDYLKGVGVFAIEMFLTGMDEVLVNEIAPRVHNSGHFSIEGSKTSQFEQHIRAITGMSLGSTEMTSPAAVMINILGEREGSSVLEGYDQALALGNTHVHVYGKMQTRPERKMGHITVLADDHLTAIEKAQLARKYISI